MAKLVITKEDKEEFKRTTNGAKKAIWMIVGMLIDFLGTLGISILNILSSKLPNMILYYVILFVLLVIIVLGGELIGVYFGALEQYVYHKRVENNNVNNIPNNNINTNTVISANPDKKVLDSNE